MLALPQSVWVDSVPTRTIDSSVLRGGRALWAVLVFIFAWFGEGVMLVWTVESMASPSLQFATASGFLAVWTVVTLLVTLYSFGMLKGKEAQGALRLDPAAITLPEGGGFFALALGQVDSISVKRAGDSLSGRHDYVLVIKSKGGKTIQSPLWDRGGFLRAVESGPWIQKLATAKKQSLG